MFYSGINENIDYNLNRKPEATVVKMKSLCHTFLRQIKVAARSPCWRCWCSPCWILQPAVWYEGHCVILRAHWPTNLLLEKKPHTLLCIQMLLWVLDAERPSYAAAVCALPSTAPLSVSHNLLCWRNSSPIIYRLINMIQQHPSAQQTRETAQKWEPNKTITHGKQTGNYNNQIRLQELFQLPRHFIRHGITKENRPELSHLTLLGKLPLLFPPPQLLFTPTVCLR